jgi:cytochrome c biogenesis protein CcmG/thiol:disulfide interchange protein DsbE
MPRRPIILALAVAVIATAGILALVDATRPGAGTETIAKGQPVPDIVGTTLDGQPFRLSDLRGKPVVVNFWGPSCVPCRDEFPLLKAKLAQHGPEGLAIVGVLMDDPPEPARDFVARYGAEWPTVVDPDKAARNAFQVAARPQTYFIDSAGVLRSIQIGEVVDADFERQYALIAQ